MKQVNTFGVPVIAGMMILHTGGMAKFLNRHEQNSSLGQLKKYRHPALARKMARTGAGYPSTVLPASSWSRKSLRDSV